MVTAVYLTVLRCVLQNNCKLTPVRRRHCHWEKWQPIRGRSQRRTPLPGPPSLRGVKLRTTPFTGATEYPRRLVQTFSGLSLRTSPPEALENPRGPAQHLWGPSLKSKHLGEPKNTSLRSLSAAAPGRICRPCPTIPDPSMSRPLGRQDNSDNTKTSSELLPGKPIKVSDKANRKVLEMPKKRVSCQKKLPAKLHEDIEMEGKDTRSRGPTKRAGPQRPGEKGRKFTRFQQGKKEENADQWTEMELQRLHEWVPTVVQSTFFLSTVCHFAQENGSE